jgi:hypothetical protein
MLLLPLLGCYEAVVDALVPLYTKADRLASRFAAAASRPPPPEDEEVGGGGLRGGGGQR